MNENKDKKEINFYYLKSEFNDVVQKLVKKLIEQKQSVLLSLKDDSEINNLDKFLWVKDKNSFLPHKKISEKLSYLDKIVLSCEKYSQNECLKKFDQVIISPNVIIKKFNFFRRFFVFSYEKTNNNSLENIKSKLKLRGFKVSCYFEHDKFKWKQI
tara:strand:+ start:1510 stop:1977 length:468 start_codon:yes stop_codon:yes gene_type:complete